MTQENVAMIEEAFRQVERAQALQKGAEAQADHFLAQREDALTDARTWKKAFEEEAKIVADLRRVFAETADKLFRAREKISHLEDAVDFLLPGDP